MPATCIWIVEVKWTALALAALAAPALPQAEEGRAAWEPAALTLSVEHGADAARTGFKLIASGAAPGSRLLLAVQPRGGPSALGWISADARGSAEWTVRGWRDARPLLAQVRGLSAGGIIAAGSTSIQPRPPAGALPHQEGSIVILEFLKDPTFVPDSAGEWIEIVNRTLAPIDLEGWKLYDGGNDLHVLANGGSGILIQSGQRFVLGRNGDPSANGGVAVDYAYSGFVLGNGGDEIRLSAPSGLLVDQVAYDDGIFWPDSPGKAISLSYPWSSAAGNDDPAHWCDAVATFAAGNPDLGTPGQANPTCP